MRKLIILAVALAACGSHSASPNTRPTPVTDNATGAASPRAAVMAFLGAAKAEDLQSMAAIWGTADGPARDVLPRDELEKRELIMIRCFRHDSAKILGETTGERGKQILPVELKSKALTGSTNFTVVPGPRGRWYVEEADIAPLKDFCSRR